MSIQIKTDNNIPIILKTKTFSGGERHIQLYELPDQLPQYFYVRCRIDCSDALMDILLLQNALNHHYDTDVKLYLEIPYLPYARQDRVCATGQAFSLEVMAQLLKSINTEHLQVWDCHSPVGLELTGATNIAPVNIIEHCGSLVTLLKDHDSVLVCPDKGAIKRCSTIADRYDVQHMVVCEKIRDPETGYITHTKVLAENLTGKHTIITDDICDGGSTFIRIAKELRKMQVASITLYVTHGIFSKGLDVFDGLVDKIYTTNSFEQKTVDKLTVINYKNHKNQ